MPGLMFHFFWCFQRLSKKKKNQDTCIF